MNRLAAREGQSTVEFALSAPLVILLLVAVLDFGRALNAYVTVANAAREGLLVASRPVPESSLSAQLADIVAAVAERSAPLDAARLSVSAQYSNDGGSTWAGWTTAGAITPGETLVRVQVAYPWSAATTISAVFFAGGTGAATFRASATGVAQGYRP